MGLFSAKKIPPMEQNFRHEAFGSQDSARKNTPYGGPAAEKNTPYGGHWEEKYPLRAVIFHQK